MEVFIVYFTLVSTVKIYSLLPSICKSKKEIRHSFQFKEVVMDILESGKDIMEGLSQNTKLRESLGKKKADRKLDEMNNALVQKLHS